MTSSFKFVILPNKLRMGVNSTRMGLIFGLLFVAALCMLTVLIETAAILHNTHDIAHLTQQINTLTQEQKGFQEEFKSLSEKVELGVETPGPLGELVPWPSSEAERLFNQNMKTYRDDTYGFLFQYSEDALSLDGDATDGASDARTTLFRFFNTDDTISVAVKDNPHNLTSQQWLDEAYQDFSQGYQGTVHPITIGKEQASWAIGATNPGCDNEWLIIPRRSSLYTLHASICGSPSDRKQSLRVFREVGSTFRFVR